MTDDETVLRDAKARIRVIDQRLGEYDRLVDERKMLQGVVDWYETSKGQDSLFKSTLSVVPFTNRLEIADKRFHPRPDSNTSKMLEEVVRLLKASEEGWMAFTAIADCIPREIVGTGVHWREGIRTAIKRAGGRYGIRYETGGVVRLLNKAPRAAETA